MSELAIWHQGRNLFAGHERDPGFREVVLRHNVVGMGLTGVLGIGLVVAFLTGSWIEGKEFVLVPGGLYTSLQVALVDKAFIILVGAGAVLLSRSRAGARWGRLIVGILASTIVVAIAFDDAARGDTRLTPIYVTITLIVAVGAMPFRFMGALILCVAAIASCIATIRLFPGPVEMADGDLLVLVLAGAVLSVVSLFLYNVRYQQYRIQRNMRLLKERVERQAVSLRTKNQFIRKIFGRYLTDEVVERLLESPSGLHMGGHKAAVTILMADIRGFSSLSERLDPESVVTVLNTYLESMTRIIEAFGGTIDEFIGDAIMVIFGAPESLQDDAFRAVACAVAMQREVDHVNAASAFNDLPPIEVGIGVHTGEAVVGNIGSEARAKYGVVGSVVNVAARIESYSVGGQILISESTLRAADAPVQVSSELSVEPKGVSRAIRLFEVTGVGEPYNLSLAAPSVELVPVREALPVRFSILEEKFVGRTVHFGGITALSVAYAELVSDVQLPSLSNLKLYMSDRDGRTLPGDVFAKVVSVNGNGDDLLCRLRFTSLSPECRRFLEDYSDSFR